MQCQNIISILPDYNGYHIDSFPLTILQCIRINQFVQLLSHTENLEMAFQEEHSFCNINDSAQFLNQKIYKNSVKINNNTILLENKVLNHLPHT